MRGLDARDIPSGDGGSVRDRLVAVAIDRFAADGYAVAGLTGMAAAAGVTPVTLHRHFAGKPELYAAARADVDRRTTARMISAANRLGGEPSALRLRAALLAGHDYATGNGFARILSEPHPLASYADPVAALLGRLAEPSGARRGTIRVVTGDMLAAAWRVALAAAAGGTSPDATRSALLLFAGTEVS